MKKKLNLEKNFISAVVYTKNDRAELKNFLTKIVTLLSKHFEHFEIIVVDDSGKSVAKNIISEFSTHSKTGANLSLIEMGYSQGVESAMNAGVDFSIGDFILEFDSVYIDYPMDTIMTVYQEALKDNDIVAAAPANSPRLTSRFFYRLFNKHSHVPESLTTEAFCIVSRRAINRISNMSVKIPYRKAVYANCGLRKKTITYQITNSSKKHLGHQYRRNIAIDSLILFTDIAYKFAITMSFVMMLLLIGVAIYAVAVFISGGAIAGWTTTIMLLCFAFFGIFVILTIVIKYLSIITNLVFQRQSYIIRSTSKYML